MKETGKAQYLFKNMAFFTVGNFVSKLLVFFLVPFYTTVLSEAEYGVADVMQTTLLLLIPLLSVNAGEAALRYCLEYTDDRDFILWAGLKRVVISFLPVVIGSLAFFFLIPVERTYIFLFILLYIADSFYEYLILYCQGCEEVQKMMGGSIVCTVLVIASNLILLLYFKLGIYGYLISQIVAFSGSAVLIFLLMDGPEKLRKCKKDRELEKELKGYGSSMLLYSTASWANNAIDRYFILILLGSVQNGLYGVAYKIPAILTTLQRIFAMAWQMSAVKEYKGDDRESFFSEMYRDYQTVLVLGAAFLILLLKPIAALMFKKAFFDAWPLVPPLIISVVFGALEGFLGSVALAFKDGRSMGYATGVGAVFNIVLNFFLIRSFGTMGAATATLISYFVMFALAFIFVRKHIILRVDLLRDAAAFVLLIIESVMVIGNVSRYMLINAGIVLVLLLLFIREEAAILRKGLGLLENSGVYRKIKGMSGACEWVTLAMFLLLMLASFVHQKIYSVLSPYETLIMFAMTGVIYIMLTISYPGTYLKVDRVSASGIAAVLITVVNLFLLGSGKGAMLIIFDLVLILTLIIRGMTLSGKVKRICAFSGAAFMLLWYPVVRWDYGFNTVGLMFLILLIFGELAMEYVKNDLESEYLKYVQILFLITSFLLAVCYQARSAALSVIVFGIIYLLAPALVSKRLLYNIWIGLFTLGSLAFTFIYAFLGTSGWNMRILYKDVLSGRELIWGELWQAFLKNPLTGIGSSYVMKSFFMFEVHNGMMDILVVHGVLVFILLLYLLIKALNRLFSRDIIFCPDKRIAFAGIYTLMFQSFFENGFIVTPFSAVFFVLMLIAV